MSEPRVVIAMAHTSDYLPLASLTVPTVQQYCEKHHYSFYYHPAWESRFENDGDRCKIRIYQELYALGEWDVFVWIDSDAMITNSDVTINDLLERMNVQEHEHFLWAYDIKCPNTGVYIARFTPEAAMFLHCSLRQSEEMGWGDNTAMIQVGLWTPHKEIIRSVPGRYMNAYDYDLYGWQRWKEVGDWRTARNAGEDFILHFPGIETFPNLEHPERPNRLALVEKYLKECK